MSTQQNNFIKRHLHQAVCATLRTPAASISALVLTGALMSAPVMAQQSGSIKGKVSTEIAGISVAGVTVTASSNVMPKPRTATTKANGTYTLPALLPGQYTLTFTSADGTVRETTVKVFLDQASNVSIALNKAPVDSTEVIYVTASKIIREGNASLTNSLRLFVFLCSYSGVVLHYPCSPKRIYCSRNRTRFNSSAILQIKLCGVSFHDVYGVDY